MLCALRKNSRYGIRIYLFKFKGDGCVVVDSLFFVAPIVYEGFEIGPCFVMKYLEPSKEGEERAIYFTIIINLISCDCYCSVSLPHGAVV